MRSLVGQRPKYRVGGSGGEGWAAGSSDEEVGIESSAVARGNRELSDEEGLASSVAAGAEGSREVSSGGEVDEAAEVEGEGIDSAKDSDLVSC